MAVSVTVHGKLSMGNAKGTLASIAFIAGDYSSGVTLSASDLRLGRIEGVLVLGTQGGGVAAFHYDRVTGKLRGYGSSATPGVTQETSGAQAAAASPVYVLAIGDNVNKG